MVVYIVRHAWAEEADDTAWPDDSQRPLTAEGRKRFAAMVRTLADRGFAPEVIATSPLVRCRETAEIMAKHVRGKPKVVELEALAPGSDMSRLLKWIQREAAKGAEVACVGHAPDVGHLLAAFIGDAKAAVRFAKGAVAAVEFAGSARPGEGELLWLVSAKLLGC